MKSGQVVFTFSLPAGVSLCVPNYFRIFDEPIEFYLLDFLVAASLVADLLFIAAVITKRVPDYAVTR